MQTYEDIEAEIRVVAMSLPPSELDSPPAVQAIARYVYNKLAAKPGTVLFSTGTSGGGGASSQYGTKITGLKIG